MFHVEQQKKPGSGRVSFRWKSCIGSELRDVFSGQRVAAPVLFTSMDIGTPGGRRQAADLNCCWIDSLVGGANGRAQGNALRMANFLKSAGPLPAWTYRFEESAALSPADAIETVKPWLFSMNAVARRRKIRGTPMRLDCQISRFQPFAF